MTQLPEGISAKALPQIMVALGLVIGWHGMGRFAGRGWGKSAGLGLKNSFLLVVWALFGFVCCTMIVRSTRQIYAANPFKAVLDVPNIMMEYGRLILAPEVLLVLIVGGLVGGLLAEMAARHWS